MSSTLQRPGAPATGSGKPSRAERRMPAPAPRQWLGNGLILLLLGLATWSLFEVGPDFNQIERGIDYAGRFLQRTVPFEWPSIGDTIWLSVVTLAVVLCGTALAALLAIPVAILAARNTAPFPGARGLGRALGVFSRALPDAFLALIFAMVITRGALAGILAIGIHSIGMIAKLTADAIEQIDEGPRLALRAAGASRSQEFWGAVWPQVLPSYIATVIHRSDINLRGSVILGFVGVPGLGYELSGALSTLDYRRAVPIAIILFVLCILFEVLSSWVRSSLLGAEPTGRSLGARTARALRRRKEQTAESSPVAARDPRRRPWTPDRVRMTAFGWCVAAVLVASIWISGLLTGPIVNFWQNLMIALGRLFPPTLDASKWEATFEAFVITLQIGLAATLLALVVSLVIGPLSARNVAPSSGARTGARFVLVGIRGLPELLLAFFFIILTGLGAGAAVVALAIGGVGLLGKLFADSIEEVPRGPERALIASGASRPQVFFGATLPFATPALVGHTLYLFDTNVRAAAILGVVGAPGIGNLLDNASRINQHEFSMYIILLFFVVLAIEGVSSLIRRIVA